MITLSIFGFSGHSQEFEIYEGAPISLQLPGDNTFSVNTGDTINHKNTEKRKIGTWIFFGKMKNEPGFKPDQIVEIGKYTNNRKSGIWTKYFANEQILSVITYVSNRPKGDYWVYYDNGQLQEAGHWKNNRNTGDFDRFYDNGEKQQEFKFNTTGKRDGMQKYYHDNGQLMIEGTIKEGKETGEFKEYYANGEIKAVRVYDEAGVLSAEKSKLDIKPKDEAVAEASKEIEVLDETIVAAAEEGEKQNLAEKKINPFNGNGEHTLYNKNRQVSKKGKFKNYKLLDGLWYKYDDNGILTQIMRFKRGKYVGDAPIEEEKRK